MLSSHIRVVPFGKPTIRSKQLKKDSAFGSNDIWTDNVQVTSKYTVLTFIPKSIFEQFRRVANFYFLIQGILMIIGQYTNFYVNDVTWYGTGATLLLVIICTMILQAKDDVERHRKDAIVNSRTVHYCTGSAHVRGATGTKTWAGVDVGDILIVSASEEIPADLVILTSSSSEGECFVETSNVDGESNLKVRSGVNDVHQRLLNAANLSNTKLDNDGNKIWKSASHAASCFHALSGLIQCELPNADVYKFAANMELRTSDHADAPTATELGSAHLTKREKQANSDYNGNDDNDDRDDESSDAEEDYVVGGIRNTDKKLMALSEKNLLLRGSTLRSCGWVIGAVVYAGIQTKMAMNAVRPPSKLSRMEHTINITLIIVLVAQIVLVVASDVLRLQWVADMYGTAGIHAWYLFEANVSIADADMNASDLNSFGLETDWPGWIAYFFTFFILYNNMVPISMYFTVELCCFVQALYINRDPHMRCPDNGTPAQCRSTNLCHEIGQVDYIFADKTGTITRNEMKLHCVALADQVFGSIHGNADAFSGLHARHLIARYSLEGGSQMMMSDPKKKQSKKSKSRMVDNWSLQANYDFWSIVACCHSVMIDTTNDGNREIEDVNTSSIKYDGESIDEITLLNGATKAGVRFMGKRGGIISVQYMAPLSTHPDSPHISMGESKHIQDEASYSTVQPWTEKYEVLFVNVFFK